MINRGKEFADIALEYPDRALVILAHLVRESAKAVHCAVRAFILATKIRISDERAVEKWIELAVYRMMEQAIAHESFVYVTRFWVVNFEMLIRAVLIRTTRQLVVERSDVFNKVILKLLHIFFVSLTATKLLPCFEQVVRGDDMVVRYILMHSSERTPPANEQQPFVPVVLKLKEAYLAWQAALPHVAKAHRQTVGARIDAALLDSLESTFRATYLPPIQKIHALQISIERLDVAKFLLLVGWESNAITNGQQVQISTPLIDASKMLVNWQTYLQKKTPARSERK